MLYLMVLTMTSGLRIQLYLASVIPQFSRVLPYMVISRRLILGRKRSLLSWLVMSTFLNWDSSGHMEESLR